MNDHGSELRRGASRKTALNLGWLAALTLITLPCPAAPLAKSAKVDFNYHIKPLLSDRCFACHGPDEKGRKGKLRLDTPEGAFKALDDGMFVIKPGDTAHSEVVRRITSTDNAARRPTSPHTGTGGRRAIRVSACRKNGLRRCHADRRRAA